MRNPMTYPRNIFFFLLVPIIPYCLVLVLPFAGGFCTTFTSGVGNAFGGKFAGFRNYAEAIADPQFWTTLVFSLSYVVLVVLLTNVLAFGLALFVTSGLRMQNGIRTIVFLPNLIGGVILGFIWHFIFLRVTPAAGKMLHWELLSRSFLSSPSRAFAALVIATVWKYSGYMMLIYIAGLMNIPRDLLEASEIDGATKWLQIVKIKLPLMLSSVTVSVFLTIQRAFLDYDVNVSLTNGGPYRSTELISLHIYNEAFLYQRYGSGQAKAILLFALIACISLIQVRSMNRLERS